MNGDEEDREMLRKLEERACAGEREGALEVGTNEWFAKHFIPPKIMEWMIKNPHLVPEKYKNRKYAFRGVIYWVVGKELHKHGVYDSQWHAISPDFWTPDTSAVEVSEVTFIRATGERSWHGAN